MYFFLVLYINMLGVTVLREGSARSRGVYLTVPNTHKRQTSTTDAIRASNPNKIATYHPHLRLMKRHNFVLEAKFVSPAFNINYKFGCCLCGYELAFQVHGRTFVVGVWQ